ncbi:histone deacetylase family protein [Bosea sp. 2KB_26]|uniref:histone deacetylase family protein n=1 Tax=Bosea sp. 2KB_26 TaxID=3237475 RepID=UPI003F8E6D04
MKTIFHSDQYGHHVRTRLSGGSLVPALEIPDRARALLAAAEECTEAVLAPGAADLALIRRVHDADYLDFLATGFSRWSKRFPGNEELRPSLHPNAYMRRRPQDLLGQAGYYIADAASVLLADSWAAILASAATALDATRLVLDGDGAAYGLCRPPGHHAYRDQACGYCFLNNAALAASKARDSVDRVTIIDVDVHHGNGTQSLFYERDDVQTISIHADPATVYPFYAGYADEIGAGRGEGFNLNLPVPEGADDAVYRDAVGHAVSKARDFAPDVLVIALGLDQSQADPFACTAVTTEGFRRMGESLAGLRRPTVIIQEGGYPSPVLGANLAAFLTGFQESMA